MVQIMGFFHVNRAYFTGAYDNAPPRLHLVFCSDAKPAKAGWCRGMVIGSLITEIPRLRSATLGSGRSPFSGRSPMDWGMTMRAVSRRWRPREPGSESPVICDCVPGRISAGDRKMVFTSRQYSPRIFIQKKQDVISER